MQEPTSSLPERTGIEGAASVFAAAAVINVVLALVLLQGGWLGEVGAFRFFFLGLELGAVAVTTAAVALALGPHRGRGSRTAWLAGGSALLLVGFALVWLLPRLLGPGGG